MNEDGGFYEGVKSECLHNRLQKEDPYQSHKDDDVQTLFFIGKNQLLLLYIVSPPLSSDWFI